MNTARVLENISLDIPQGKMTAFVGPSGSGKSTAVKLIANLWDPDAGRITIGSVDMKDIPTQQLNRLVSYVSQDVYLFDTTIMENIRMGKPSATDEEVIAAAESAACDEFIRGLEKEYETLCGSGGGHLSGGERQRISIARAILKNAPVVILDEATSSVDPENEALIQSAISALAKDKTLIVIAHRLNTVTGADKLVLINEGHIAAEGTHGELLASSDEYRRLWESYVRGSDSREEAC